MTPERKHEISLIKSWWIPGTRAELLLEDAPKIVDELLAALEEAEQQAKAWQEVSVKQTNELVEAQQTIARQREAWEELKGIVSTNATGGKGEDINDYDIMLNIMGDLESAQP